VVLNYEPPINKSNLTVLTNERDEIVNLEQLHEVGGLWRLLTNQSEPIPYPMIVAVPTPGGGTIRVY